MYQHDITLKDAAKVTGFSEYHFSRLFKDIAAKTFHRYLNEFRIKEAEKLLINKYKAVSEVAMPLDLTVLLLLTEFSKKLKDVRLQNIEKFRDNLL